MLNTPARTLRFPRNRKGKLAEPYLNHLSRIVERLEPIPLENVTLETKHFFSGAALYANGKICASLSPGGFAVKLPEEVRQNLIGEGSAQEFRFFERGPIKREYVVLVDAIVQDEKALRKLIEIGAQYVVGEPS